MDQYIQRFFHLYLKIIWAQYLNIKKNIITTIEKNILYISFVKLLILKVFFIKYI